MTDSEKSARAAQNQRATRQRKGKEGAVTGANPTATSQTLARGLDLLTLVAGSAEGLTPTEIAAGLKLSRTIVYRLLSTLAEYEFIRRSDEGRVTIGMGVLKLTDNLFGILRDISRPILERLAEETSATAHLSIVEGDESVALIVVEPRTTAYHLAYRAGVRQPIPRGAIGRALQAAGKGEEGIFVSHGELIPGATGVAAAIAAVRKMPCTIGVVSVEDVDVDDFSAQVLRAADQLVTALRASSYATAQAML